MSATPITARIYVGNINFNATEDELKQHFSEFDVASVEIPSKTILRGTKTYTKRLGFGFVQFENEADADRAIEKFDGSQFKLRQIYAKKALPPISDEERAEKSAAFLAKKKLLKEKAEKEKSEKAEQKVKEKAEKAEKAEKEAKENESNGNGDVAEEATTKENVKDAAKKPKKRTRVRKPAANGTSKVTSKEETADVVAEGTAASTTSTASHTEVPSKAKKTPRERPSKQPKGVESTSTVFVTNLEYKATSKTLSELFKELEPVWVHVPTRKVPYHIMKLANARKVSLFNKGIAFVKFPSQDAQLKAIADFNGTEINGKNIVLQVAINRDSAKDGDAEGSKAETAEGSEISEPAGEAADDSTLS